MTRKRRPVAAWCDNCQVWTPTPCRICGIVGVHPDQLTIDDPYNRDETYADPDRLYRESDR